MKFAGPTSTLLTCGLILTAYAVLAVTDAQTLNDDKTVTLDFSCLAICSASCAGADRFCRLFPGPDARCDDSLTFCTSSCQTSCACVDECVGGCQSDEEACAADDSIDIFFRGVACTTRAAVCRGNCPLSCGVQAATDAGNAPS